MKKFIAILLTSFAFVMLFSNVAFAANLCDESVKRGSNGIVPCGRGGCYDPNTCVNPNTGAVVGCNTDGAVYKTVTCDTTFTKKCNCEIGHLFLMVRSIYIFITWFLAIPLAGLLIVIGGVVMLVSGGNPTLFEKGKTILWGAGWGLLIIFGAWLVVNIIFMALGYAGSWFAF